MRCIDIPCFGGPDVLRLTERPLVRPGPGELLLRVAAAGVNRGDTVQRRGNYPPPPGASDIPGLEVSGIVAALGEGVAGWRVGDPVCALLAGGGYAEYCLAPSAQCLPIPAGVSLLQAAALPEACFTVWTMLWQAGRLAPGEAVLIQGGASGIGVSAIQMAAALGHRVIATAGTDAKCQACTELGAELAINYRSTDFVTAVHEATAGRGVNVILDMVGGDYVAREMKALADGGRIIFIAFLRGSQASFDIKEMMMRRLTLTGATLRARSVEYKGEIAKSLRERIWPHIESGTIRPVIDRVYALEQATKAHERIESGEHTGKILLSMPDFAPSHQDGAPPQLGSIIY
jgi:NADPH2:quinone reductase